MRPLLLATLFVETGRSSATVEGGLRGQVVSAEVVDGQWCRGSEWWQLDTTARLCTAAG